MADTEAEAEAEAEAATAGEALTMLGSARGHQLNVVEDVRLSCSAIEPSEELITQRLVPAKGDKVLVSSDCDNDW